MTPIFSLMTTRTLLTNVEGLHQIHVFYHVIKAVLDHTPYKQ